MSSNTQGQKYLRDSSHFKWPLLAYFFNKYIKNIIGNSENQIIGLQRYI